MAPTPRQAEILGVLKMRGKAAISELSELLEVSDETVRRDLKGLSADGLVEKFHGGVRLSISRTEPPFERRLRDAVEAKRRIARRAAAFIDEGATVLLDNSTTASFLARELVAFCTELLEVVGTVQILKEHLLLELVVPKHAK